MLNPEHGGFPELNTTRTRKSSPASPDGTASKAVRSRAKSSAPAVASAVAKRVKPKAEAASALAPAAVKVARRAAKPPVTATPAKPAARAGSKAPVATAATARKPEPRKSSTPKLVAAPVVAAAAPVKVPRKSSKAKPSALMVDVQVRDAVIARLDAMKAQDLKVIDVRGKTSITDCLVIASGTSTRHVKSMGDEVVVTAKKFGMPPIGIEGEKECDRRRAFCRRPNGRESVLSPCFFPVRSRPSAVKGTDFDSVLPYRKRSPQFASFFEIAAKNRVECFPHTLLSR